MNLKTVDLKKKYGQKTILNGISSNINMNTVTGLLGPNGAGKTTFFYILAGLLNPSNGDIFIDDELITHKSIRERSRLGLVYLPQEPSIFRELTVYQNIKSALEMQNLEKSNLKIKIAAINRSKEISNES